MCRLGSSDNFSILNAGLDVGSGAVRELSAAEIEFVSGGLLQMPVGAAIGGGGYLIGAALAGGFSWGGLLGATVAGGITGGLSAVGVGAVGAGMGGAFMGGLTDLLIER